MNVGQRYKVGNKWALYLPEYRKSNKTGLVYEHIYNFQEYNKCCLLPWSIVTHIDGNKHNNMPWNLQGMTIHQFCSISFIKNTEDRFCHECGSTTTRYRHRKEKLKPHWYKIPQGYQCSRCFMRGYMRRYYVRHLK